MCYEFFSYMLYLSIEGVIYTKIKAKDQFNSLNCHWWRMRTASTWVYTKAMAPTIAHAIFYK